MRKNGIPNVHDELKCAFCHLLATKLPDSMHIDTRSRPLSTVTLRLQSLALPVSNRDACCCFRRQTDGRTDGRTDAFHQRINYTLGVVHHVTMRRYRVAVPPGEHCAKTMRQRDCITSTRTDRNSEALRYEQWNVLDWTDERAGQMNVHDQLLPEIKINNTRLAPTSRCEENRGNVRACVLNGSRRQISSTVTSDRNDRYPIRYWSFVLSASVSFLQLWAYARPTADSIGHRHIPRPCQWRFSALC